MAAILDFRLSGWFRNVGVSMTEKFDLENMRVAAGILFLSALELQIHLGVILPPPPRWPLTVVKIIGHMRVKRRQATGEQTKDVQFAVEDSVDRRLANRRAK